MAAAAPSATTPPSVSKKAATACSRSLLHDARLAPATSAVAPVMLMNSCRAVVSPDAMTSQGDTTALQEFMSITGDAHELLQGGCVPLARHGVRGHNRPARVHEHHRCHG